jgi:hypothetical protein
MSKMRHFFLLVTLLFVVLFIQELVDAKSLKHPGQLNIVFVYTVVKSSCKNGLPAYIRYALEQSIFSQPDCNTVLLSNIQDCAVIGESVKDIEGLVVIDSVPITSPRTKQFENVSSNVFLDTGNSLWMTSAIRFFLLEDLMRNRGWHELMHVEADNMIYGRFTSILPQLRHFYPLAATPLNIEVTFITASVFWVANLKSLVQFDDYLLGLALNTNKTHDRYIDFLRPSSSKEGGLYPDASGNGVKIFAINEMSMLAYYHSLYPKELVLLPVVPAHPFPTTRYTPNVSEFGPMGTRSGHVISHAVWDPNSWGQFIGGTYDYKGKNKRFTDATHIAGVAIRVGVCQVVFWCSNITDVDYGFHHDRHGRHHLHHKMHHGLPALALSSLNSSVTGSKRKGHCYTAPFVRCGDDKQWTPLWNLHVHSKHTIDYKSSFCDCEREGGKGNVSIYVDNFKYKWKPEKIPFEV